MEAGRGTSTVPGVPVRKGKKGQRTAVRCSATSSAANTCLKNDQQKIYE